MCGSDVHTKRRLRSVEQAEAIRRQAGELYAARREYLLGIAWRSSACEADAEEAVQDAFLAFIETYDPAGGAPPIAWLSGPNGGSPPAVEARVVDLEEARARLRELKPDERTAIGLAAAGYSYGEIAERRGWTKTKVNRCLYEGRSALRKAA
jgi:DNA-directed RNA polymerase specialized sigma24 family protein